MNKILKLFCLAGTLFFFVLLNDACTSTTTFRPLPNVARILRDNTWVRVFYSDSTKLNVNEQTFDFQYTDVVIANQYKNGKNSSDTMSFSFDVVSLKTYVKIAQKNKKGDPFFKGDWEVMRLEKKSIPGLGRKYVLHMVRNGAADDGNPITTEGGLNMMEFIEK